MNTVLVTNAKIVNEGQCFEGDVLIKGGRIERIDGEIPIESGNQVVDADGKLLIPGMIDDQVHFREPGATQKGEILTESRAAVAGGITSFMDMPNTNPPTLSREALQRKYIRASEVSSANYAFYLGASNDNIDDIRGIGTGEACGVKVFMGASTGNMLVDDEKTLEAIFQDSPLLIATHCEDTPTILRNENDYRERFGEDVPMEAHPDIRSEQACYKSSSMAVELARKYGSRLHVLHLTTARELELFECGPVTGKRITAEACVHHLYFDRNDYAEKGSLIKCNPAIKRPTDREALLKGIVENRVDVIATDHAPHTLEEKGGTYFNVPAGLPLVQYALPSLFEHYHSGQLSLETIVHKTAHAPALCFGVKDRGFIREGYWADLVIIDPDCPHTVNRDDVVSKCGWSPFEGRTFRARINTTFVNGEIACRNGQVKQTRGRRLEFV